MDTLELPSRKKKMPPKLDDKTETDRVQLVAPRSLLRQVGAWRREQEPIPNLSAAIRRLLEIALEVEAERKASSSTNVGSKAEG